MLVDLLAVVIGFAAVMLLLSLFVTSLVQLTQHVLRFRVRNFEHGIAGLLEGARKTGDKYDSGEVAREVIDVATLPSVKAGGLFDKALSWVGRGKCTWLTGDELAVALRGAVGKVADARIEEVQARFPLAERQMSASLLALMRYTTVIWAALIACLFQVSTPMLLERLTTDSLYRQKLADTAESVLDRAEETRTRPTPEQPIRSEAPSESKARQTNRSQTPGGVGVPATERQDFKNGFTTTAALAEAPDTEEGMVPAYSETLDRLRTELQEQHLLRTREDAGRRGTRSDDILDGSDTNLADVPVDREAVLREIANMLDRLGGQEIVESSEESRETRALLGLTEIKPWPHGRAFYADAANYVGVLMTTILLTLGAPFWFDLLKNVVNLRDTLEPSRKQADTDDGNQP